MIPKSIALIAAAALLVHAAYTALITAWRQHANASTTVGTDGYIYRPSSVGSNTVSETNAAGDLAPSSSSSSSASSSSLGQRLAGVLTGSTLTLHDNYKYFPNANAQILAHDQLASNSKATDGLADSDSSNSGAELSAEAKAAIDAQVAAYASRLAEIVSYTPPMIAQAAPNPGNVASEPAELLEARTIAAPVNTPLRVKSPPRPRPQTATVPLPPKPHMKHEISLPPPQASPQLPADRPMTGLELSRSIFDATSAHTAAVATAPPPASHLAAAGPDVTAGLSPVEAAFVNANGSPRSVLFNPKYAPVKSDVLVYVHVPKTAGSVFFDKMKARAKGLRYYPDGQHSFHDRGCGEKGGTAHCDYSEIEVCFETDYAKGMSPSLQRTPFEKLKYATLLRDPIKRVVSEFFWGCGAKVNKRFTGEHEGKVLFDWPRPLWDSMGKSCLKGAPGSEFKKWLQGSGNPSHNRFIKMLANNTRAPPLRRKHNCAIGNEQATVEVWAVRYGMKGAEAASKSGGLLGAPHEPPKSRTQLWAALNRDQGLLKEVLAVLDTRFWFVGILEELDLSISVFCALGNHCGGGSRNSVIGRGKNGGRGRRLSESGDTYEEDLPFNYGVYDDSSKGVDDYDGSSGNDETSSEDDDDRISSSMRDNGAADYDFGNEAIQASRKHQRRSLLQKHSSKPIGFKLDSTTRDEVSAANALDVKLYSLIRQRLHAAAAKHAPTEFSRLKGSKK